MTAPNLEMDSNALHEWIARHGPVHVVFNAKSEDMECYPEEGIQCIITGVDRKDSEVHTWKVDYTPFEVVNSLHESSNYYGSAPEASKNEKRPAYLSAYATRFYKRENTLYVEPNEKIGGVLQKIQSASKLDVTADAVEQRFASLQKELGHFSI